MDATTPARPARAIRRHDRRLPPIVLPPAFEAFCLLHHDTYRRYAHFHGCPGAVARAFGDLATQWQSLLTRRDLTARAWRTFTRHIPEHPAVPAAHAGRYDALVLHHRLGCTPAHVSETMGVDLHTVRWWLFRRRPVPVPDGND
jgi:hypothetical protein